MTKKEFAWNRDITEVKTFFQNGVYTTSLQFCKENATATITATSTKSVLVFKKENGEVVECSCNKEQSPGFEVTMTLQSPTLQVGIYPLKCGKDNKTVANDLNAFCAEHGINSDAVWSEWTKEVVPNNQKLTSVFKGIQLEASFVGGVQTFMHMTEEDGVIVFWEGEKYAASTLHITARVVEEEKNGA